MYSINSVHVLTTDISKPVNPRSIDKELVNLSNITIYCCTPNEIFLMLLKPEILTTRGKTPK